MPDKDLLVNNNEDTIQRCPHDEENPYAQISRELIRDMTISPECRWLIIYLLSMKNGWKINIQQIISHVKPHMGRDKLYQILNEALEAGYMKREVVRKGNLKQQTKYFVSESPKFKKCFRHPPFQYPESRGTENPDDKERTCSKEKHKKDISSLKVSSQEQSANAEEERISSPPNKKPKITSPPLEFPPEVKDLADRMVNALHEANPHWLIPKNLHCIRRELWEMMTLEKRDAAFIFNVFMWAINDHFWMDKLCKPNPIKYLRFQFGQLAGKMEAKPPVNSTQVDRRLRDENGDVVDEYKDHMF